MSEYVKMKDLVGEEVTITGIQSFKYKMWNDAEKRMMASDTPKEGHRKVYQVETDRGLLDVGVGQMGNILEALMSPMDGEVSLFGSTILVKSNGKEGMDIRYFFEQVKEDV